MKVNYTKGLALSGLMGMLMLLMGCSEEYYSMDDYQLIKKRDTHVHINIVESGVLEQAREDNFQLTTVNVDAFFPDLSIHTQRETAVELHSRYPEHVSWLTTLTLEGWDEPEIWQNQSIAYLEKSFLNGAVGLKLWKNIGMEFRNAAGKFVMIDDPQFDPVLEYLVQQGKPLLGHIGEPKEAWMSLDEMSVHRGYFENNPKYHMYLHPEYPTYEQIIEARNNMLDKHPDLKFVGAHLGSMEWSLEMMAEHLDRYPNMALEMAARMRFLYNATRRERDEVRTFFINYQDQLIYSTDLAEGTDSDPGRMKNRSEDVWKQEWEYFVTDNPISVSGVDGSFQGLKLPSGVVDKIYNANAEHWFRDS